jgi:hypothetical protein
MPHARPIGRRRSANTINGRIADPVGPSDNIVDAGRESEPFLLFATKRTKVGANRPRWKGSAGT